MVEIPADKVPDDWFDKFGLEQRPEPIPEFVPPSNRRKTIHGAFVLAFFFLYCFALVHDGFSEIWRILINW
jgi:hypothetical protein